MTNSRLSRCLGVALFVLMTCATAWPQSTTATLSGTVSDPSRAAIPAATIIATSDETGLKKTARTDSEGRYTIPFLAPGVYTVTAASEGFNSSTRFGVRLEVAQGSLLDFSLALAGIQQAIQVTAEAAPLLNTDTSGVDATLENKLIAELPSAERSSLSFLNTLPGVIDTGFALATGETQNVNSMANGGPIGSAGNRNFFDSNFGVSGGGVSTNDVLLDGISNTSPDFNGMAISPPQDSVRELKVLSGVFSAEYGRSGGAVVSIASNAGGNKFRGTIYEYFQNGDLNANGWQRNRAGYGPDGVTPALARILVKRNQFGGSLGGPVTLPFRPRSQSTFFFFNYEGRRERNPYSKILTLPTEKMRKGDLSELLLPVVRSNVPLNADGTPPLFGQVYNPYGPLVRNPNGVAVRNTIPGNRLDLLPKCGSGPHTAACLDPVGLALMDYLPLPNQPGLTNNYLYSGTTNFGKNLVAGRVDKVLSEKHSLFGRFSLENRLNVPPNFLNSVASRARAYNDTFRNFTLNDIYVFTPRVINNFRYGYLLAHAHIQTPSELAGFDITTLGLPSYMRERASMPGFPMFSFAGGPENQGIAGEITGSQIGSSGGNNQPRDTTTLADAVTFVRGRLSLKTGIEYRLMRFFYNENANPVGSFAFTRTITRGPVPTVTPSQAAEAGSTMASLLGGIPNVASMDSLIPLTCYQYYGAAFVQADWRVRPKLMLKLGLRWDVETGTGESHRQVTNFDFQAKSQLNGRVSMPPDAIVQVLRPNFTDLRGLLSFPDGPNAETSFKRFAPRVGFAYRLNEKTTLRGGYGISFLPQSFEQLSAIGVVFTTRVTQNTDSSGQVVPAGQAAAQSFFLTDPFRGNLMTPPGNTLGADTLIGQSPTLVSATRRTSYVQQYNLVIQRLLPSRFVLDVAYVGSHGVRLPFPMLDVNQLPPAFLDFARQNYAAARDANGAPATSAATFFSQQVLNPFYGIVTDPGSPLFSRTVRRDQLLKPFPQYNEPQLSRPLVGASRYDALQISLRKSYSNGLSAVVSYSFSRLKDIGCSGSTNVACGGSRLEDIYNPASDYTISDIDVPHRFTSSFSYELPVGQKKAIGQHFGRMANALAGGYQISGSLMYQSGTPISVTAPGIGLAYGVRRADAVAGVSAEIPGDEMRANIRAGGFAFNPDAYSKPADYTLGNAPRNSSDTRRDPYKNVNLSILKNFSIREGRQRIQLRGEFLNAFNMVVFGTPGRDVSNRDVVQNGIVVQRGTFARVTTQGNQPRIIQLVLRYSF